MTDFLGPTWPRQRAFHVWIDGQRGSCTAMVEIDIHSGASVPRASRSERSAALRIGIGWLLLTALVLLAVLRAQAGPASKE